jgi:hypothetical protein
VRAANTKSQLSKTVINIPVFCNTVSAEEMITAQPVMSNQGLHTCFYYRKRRNEIS